MEVSTLAAVRRRPASSRESALESQQAPCRRTRTQTVDQRSLRPKRTIHSPHACLFKLPAETINPNRRCNSRRLRWASALVFHSIDLPVRHRIVKINNCPEKRADPWSCFQEKGHSAIAKVVPFGGHTARVGSRGRRAGTHLPERLRSVLFRCAPAAAAAATWRQTCR